MIAPGTKPVTVLFLGSLTHSDETNFLDKSRPHEDQIDFQNPTRVTLIRIPRPGKDIYSKHISITQSQTIKNFEIYYRNLQKTGGRYTLLTCNNELAPSSTDDILITPKQPIFTDLLLIKGNFTKITLCIYGNLIKEEVLLLQKCPNYRTNAPIEPLSHNLIQIKKDVFEDKRTIIRTIENQIEQEDSIQKLPKVINDDGINEQQIENICTLSQKLLTSLSNQQFFKEPFVVEFRTSLEQMGANVAKIFKNKHLGLYYPSYEDSNIANDLSLSVTNLAMSSLDLSLSEQVRGLEILKFMLQLDRHADFFIEHSGVDKLIRIFVDFFKINSVVLSTYKNLILEVLICVSHWKNAAKQMMEIMKDSYYQEIFVQKTTIQAIKLAEQRQRSREKKTKKSRSESSDDSSDDEDKKKKKDKQKKRNRSRQKKKGKQSKSKEELIKKASQKQEPKIQAPKEQVPNLSFYELLLFQFSIQKNSKQLILIKILLEQILQTMTKNPTVSQRVAQSTSLLKDLKYIFNPAGEVLNTKSLKQFASCYQPFLNDVQSEGVQSDIISEKEKLKHMKKYGVNPTICKIVNKICLELAQSQCEENQNQDKTAFDSSFIVMMSQLIRSKDRSLLYGFGKMLTSFRIGSSNDIIYLKKIEAAMTMISQYIYKILVQDHGLYTVLNIDQIYTSLINIANCLSKDPSAFTRQLKRKIRQLTNYAMAYDLFNRSEGNFKTICDYFLRLFKFQHYEINKIGDFKKKEFDKLANPFSKANLSQIVNLGNFHELFPEQPLLQIDVYLKIFNMVLQFNKNVWALFYQNKLVCGFTSLFMKLSSMLTFILQSSPQRQGILLTTRKHRATVENYLTVTCRLLKILVKKAEYESAFNDLIDQDNFENVELYEKCFELYVTVFNAINQKSSLLDERNKKLGREILAMILEIYDKLMESYELTSHVSRESKLKELWCMIYEGHFVGLRARGACLALFAFFIESMESASIKLFNTYCAQQHISSQDRNLRGYIPANDKSMVQNLILANIFRSDPIIQTNLCLMIRNLLMKHTEKNPTVEKVTPFLESIFDELEVEIKSRSSFESKKDIVVLEKTVLFGDVLRRLDCSLTAKFQEKLLKFMKTLDSIKREGEIFQKSAFKLSLSIKCSILSFLKKSFSQKQEHPQILSLILQLNKNIDLSPQIEEAIKLRSLSNLTKAECQIQMQSLNLTSTSLDVICSLSSNPFNQSIMLYEVFLQKPYKPSPQISLISLFGKLSTAEIVTFMTLTDNELDEQNKILHKKLKEILIRMVYFLCQLTTIDSRQFYSTESRRNAIVCLLTEQKDFPFSKLQQFRSVIPFELLQTLKDYFSYPIVERPLTLPVQDKRESMKNRGYVFSKAMFALAMEGEMTAKARYQFIGGPWKSGDISSNMLYTPSRERNYLETVAQSVRLKLSSEKQYAEFKTKTIPTKPVKTQFELFELNTKKKTKVLEKKSVDIQTKYLNIPLVLQFQNRVDQNSMMKRVSPSPSGRGAYSKGSQSRGKEFEGRVSPSPPTSKIPGQNIIGFNGVTNGMNQPQTSYSPAVYPQPMQPMMTPTSLPMTLPLQPLGSQVPPPSMKPSENTSPMKQSPYQPTNQQLTQSPTYPNPYYGGSLPKPIQPQVTSNTSLPYLDMQKTGSQQGMRSGSNSAPRQNLPYGNVNYPQQQYYEGMGGYQNNPKMGGYDNRSHSPYGKQYQNRGYQNGGTNPYYNPAQQNMGYRDNYTPPPRQSYQPNRPYNQYPTYPPTQQYAPQQPYYPPQQQQQQRQFNQAILLVTQLRGTLPDHLKNDKKNRLNLILNSSVRIQERVKQYISGLNR